MEKASSFFSNEKQSNKVEQVKKLFQKGLYISMATIFSVAAAPLQSHAQSEASGQNTLIQQDEKVSVEAKAEFEKQRELLIAWFANRKIENPNLQRKFQQIRPEVLERLTDVKLTNTVSMAGAAEWRNDTVFYGNEVVQKTELTSAFTHELSHDAFPANYGKEEPFETKMPSWMVIMIANAIKKSGDEGLSEVALFKKYYQRPEEVYGRICAFRLVNSLKPDTKVTKDQLKEIITKINKKEMHDDNSEALLKTITDFDSLLKLLNDLP